MDFAALFAKRPNHIKPGLERIQNSYQHLGRPAFELPTILLGGTNGKGSTSGFLWSLLGSNGGQFGLYTSPHLVRFSERFQLNEGTPDDEDLARLWQELEAQLPPELYDELSFFEVATLLAFRLFEERKVRMQVLEVGLGGRWDATNISDPLVSVLVSVSRDHMEFLGHDVRGILKEKLGIMRRGRPLFWGDSGEICAIPGYRQIIDDQARELGCTVYSAGQEFGIDQGRLWIDLPGIPRVELQLQGAWLALPPFLQRNLSLAAAVYHYVASRHLSIGLAPLPAIWSRWLEGRGPCPVTLLGRSQRLLAHEHRGGQPLILDVCHNPDGARAFATALRQRQPNAPLPALVSILRDKDLNAILDALRSAFHPVILFGIEHERGWDPSMLEPRHQDLVFYGRFAEAWAAMREQKPGQPWAVCGSVAAVGQVLEWLDVFPKDMHVARVIQGDWAWDADHLGATPGSSDP
jgi:dihydrofolate synthase/folylpolyglutamate synthase